MTDVSVALVLLSRSQTKITFVPYDGKWCHYKPTKSTYFELKQLTVQQLNLIYSRALADKLMYIHNDDAQNSPSCK